METFPQHDRRWTGGPLRLGLFGANRPLKNFLSGAAAAVEMARRLHVPIELLLSSGRSEGCDARALDEMTENIANLRVTRAGWLPWPAFRRLLRTVDLVFQVSYTETFNVVSADAIAEGVPVVVSDAILESYLAPTSFALEGAQVRKGTWLLAMRVLDDDLWSQVKSGELTGLSMGGSAARLPEPAAGSASART